MSERKLTTEEIDYLYTFCGERGACFYDVQIEVVDHFASAIEKHWATDPALTLGQALQLEYNLFNANDFTRIIKEKESGLRKKYVNLRWKYVAEFFKLPKILTTIALTLALYTFFLQTNNFAKVYRLVILLVMLIILLTGLIQKKKTQINLSTDKSFLLFEEYKRIRNKMMAPIGLLYVLFVSVVNMIGKELFFSYTNYSIVKFLISFLIILNMVFCYVSMIYLPQRIKADFTREFPQFVKS
jgi:intracellular septation protein A